MKKNSIVCIGSRFFSNLDISETAQEEQFDEIIYDRSIENLKIPEGEKYIKETIVLSVPSKIFINIGDLDIEAENFNSDVFISKYEWMLFSIHNTLPNSRIYIVSVVSNNPKTKDLNQKLKDLAAQTGCDYVNICKGNKTEPTSREVFAVLKQSMRKFPIGFSDAMGYSA